MPSLLLKFLMPIMVKLKIADSQKYTSLSCRFMLRTVMDLECLFSKIDQEVVLTIEIVISKSVVGSLFSASVFPY